MPPLPSYLSYLLHRHLHTRKPWHTHTYTSSHDSIPLHRLSFYSHTQTIHLHSRTHMHPRSPTTHTRHAGVYRTHIHTDIRYYLHTIYNSISHPHTFRKIHVPILPHRPQTDWGCKCPESLGYRLCGRFGSVIDKFPSSVGAAVIEEMGAVFPSKESSHQWKGGWARKDEKPKRKTQSGARDRTPARQR